MKRIKNKKCRICEANELYEVVTLNDMPFTDEFVTETSIGKEYLAPIEIGICTQCGTVQNLNDTNMDNYYYDYEYSVGASTFATSFMDVLAKRIKEEFFKNDSTPTVFEIGSGSGEQLMMFKKYGFSVLGVEPSEYLANYANLNNIDTVQDFFHSKMLDKIRKKFDSVDCIVSSYTFDHIPFIGETFEAISSILAPSGKLIVEIHDLDLIIDRKEFCLFEHEHYIYLNKITAEYVFNKNGFEIETFNLLNAKEKRGNSLLIVAQKKSNQKKISIDIDNELVKVQNLNKNTRSTIDKIDGWLEDNKNKKIVAYGAGGRGVMTLASLKNYEYFKYIVDKNPKGENIYSSKTHLPIYKPESIKEDKVDIVFIFSYGYFQEIVEELTQYGYTKKQFVSLLDFA